ncbi:MAG: hypothetical protein KC417_00155, partial [Myxococcales bacterium]|nr:hypothetical protein [Myxococcales bacterium]
MCFRATISTFATLAFLVACGGGGGSKPGDMDGGVDDGSFKCTSNDSVACIDGVHYSCESAGAEGLGLKVKTEDCEAKGLSCFSDLGCKLCMPDLLGCNEGNVARCKSDGSAWDLVEECDPEKTLVCYTGQCQDPCEVAVAQSSYLGCDFFAADLDNAALEDGKDASSQQFAVVISNPNPVAATVTIERNDAPYGEEPNIVTVETRVVAAGDLEVFELERREVDGSSSNRQCTVDGDACPGSEVCVCLDEEQTLCRCRRSPTASGLNDGTHSALSSQAYRLRSTWPLIAYQ